jgi:hypothetical protein
MERYDFKKDLAKKALSAEDVTDYVVVFQSSLCNPVYTKKFIQKVLPNLHKSYAETLQSKGNLSPSNKLLLEKLIKEEP